jgi:hypothetical protein
MNLALSDCDRRIQAEDFHSRRLIAFQPNKSGRRECAARRCVGVEGFFYWIQVRNSLPVRL